MANMWLELAEARKLVETFQLKYSGKSAKEEGNLQTITYDFLTNSRRKEGWDILVHYDVFDCVTWLQIETGSGIIPR